MPDQGEPAGATGPAGSSNSHEGAGAASASASPPPGEQSDGFESDGDDAGISHDHDDDVAIEELPPTSFNPVGDGTDAEVDRVRSYLLEMNVWLRNRDLATFVMCQIMSNDVKLCQICVKLP